ncbi:helix-turn-helix domain-containing protein [Nocardia huaxiensis]|uniref:Helix-turn-helix transcriptional regulator n=1 Tax=Nocardia huaxiensis TaxID=2755382 RepID=A0A7D6Z2G8_9NOCA|nr:helix-turn-helix domain-containing protein [Nocardia huaxiensis]QLY31186.1 helix-turn-helix transcriptional regulator [Nocardia huaxiensis]UFS94715.1 helix-turn-helix domain-containing protein [Nocardia huaxiensis]
MVDVRSDLLSLLRHAGVHVAAGTHEELLLKTPDDRVVAVQIKATQRRLTLATIAPAMAAQQSHPSQVRLLYIASSASDESVAAAAAGAFDLVTTDPPRVVIAGQVLTEAPEPQSWSSDRRPAWGQWAILRVLALSTRPLRQNELSTIIGISQQAVSHALRKMPGVTQTRNGTLAADGALDMWGHDYPGPGGTVSHWYGLDDPSTQVTKAHQLLDELELPSVVSGDIAADTYAPWQLPTSVRLYVPEIIDFTPIGFSPADPENATMSVAVPEDPTVMHTAAMLSANPRTDRHHLADAAITWWDLLHTSRSTTAREAADRLKTEIATGAFGA